MIIIPAIDIINGQCVRLTKGDYATTKVYNTDPLEVAKSFEDAGLTHLHLVDLDGAKKGEVINWAVLKEICEQTNLKVDFSGGIKSNEALEKTYLLGADKATIGSLAVKDPVLFREWIQRYGSEKLILGADVMGDKIAIQGWQSESEVEIMGFLEKYLEEGIDYVMCTDISKDGMMEGPSFTLYKKIIKTLPEIKLIASGGVSSLEDLDRLREMDCYGAIVGKAIYEGKISLAELADF